MRERSLQPYYPELSRLGTEMRLSTGTVLWREGDPGDSMALVVEGTLEVVYEPPDGEPVVLRTLEAGAVVGELASTDGRARSATVRALTPVRLLKIPAPISVACSAAGRTSWRRCTGSRSSACAA